MLEERLERSRVVVTNSQANLFYACPDSDGEGFVLLPIVAWVVSYYDMNDDGVNVVMAVPVTFDRDINEARSEPIVIYNTTTENWSDGDLAWGIGSDELRSYFRDHFKDKQATKGVE